MQQNKTIIYTAKSWVRKLTYAFKNSRDLLKCIAIHRENSRALMLTLYGGKIVYMGAAIYSYN